MKINVKCKWRKRRNLPIKVLHKQDFIAYVVSLDNHKVGITSPKRGNRYKKTNTEDIQNHN